VPLARWDGTSFSAPVVAGMIAARMGQTGENAKDARDALLAQAEDVPGLGKALRV
jgi:subtilase family serine protease